GARCSTGSDLLNVATSVYDDCVLSVVEAGLPNRRAQVGPGHSVIDGPPSRGAEVRSRGTGRAGLDRLLNMPIRGDVCVQRVRMNAGVAHDWALVSPDHRVINSDP